MRRVNTVHLKTHRFAVGALRPVGGDHQLAAHDVVVPLAVGIQAQGGHDDEFAVAVGDVRRPDAVGIPDGLQIQVVGIGDGVADDFPVDHILGVADGDGGEILESGVDHIVVVSHTNDRGVGKEAALYRILICITHFVLLPMLFTFFS